MQGFIVVPDMYEKELCIKVDCICYLSVKEKTRTFIRMYKDSVIAKMPMQKVMKLIEASRYENAKKVRNSSRSNG